MRAAWGSRPADLARAAGPKSASKAPLSLVPYLEFPANAHRKDGVVAKEGQVLIDLGLF
jgi:hypothetical protein